jgi:tetratricopeptide (TPR) repeat protein
MVPGEDIEHFFAMALDAASKGAAIDRTNVMALKALAATNHYTGHYAESERYQLEALELNPNDPDTLAQLGWRLAVRGRFDEGIPYLQRAIARSVNPPGWYFHLIVVDLYLRGKYDEMLNLAQRSAAEGSAMSWSFVAIAYAELGNAPEAKQALARMAEIDPQLGRDPAGVYRSHQPTDAIVSALMEGLRKAGWVEPRAAVSP